MKKLREKKRRESNSTEQIYEESIFKTKIHGSIASPNWWSFQSLLYNVVQLQKTWRDAWQRANSRRPRGSWKNLWLLRRPSIASLPRCKNLTASERHEERDSRVRAWNKLSKDNLLQFLSMYYVVWKKKIHSFKHRPKKEFIEMSSRVIYLHLVDEQDALRSRDGVMTVPLCHDGCYSYLGSPMS